MRETRHGRLAAGAVAAAAAAALIAGCGGSSSEPPSAANAGSGLVSPTASSSSSRPASGACAGAVACISGTPISKPDYEHWLAVERATGAGADAGRRAEAFLITSSWVLGEAARRKASVTEGEVQSRLKALEHKSFPGSGQLRAFLKRSRQSEADLAGRVKVELLSGLIKGEVESGKLGSKQAKAKLVAFERAFKSRWRALTDCGPGYVMEDCRQYKGKGEPQLSAPVKASTGATGAKSAASGASGAGGEVYSRPGAFSIESPAFQRNGAIPASYTCDGAGTSPPLSFANVPKHAAELVLFVIDDTGSGRSGGIRWVVGDIAPSTHTIAAGHAPAGAIVGDNAEGKASYGAICPAKGRTDTIELVAYALKRPIKLSPGFQPSVAEREYGSSKDILGEAAVTYATYHRP